MYCNSRKERQKIISMLMNECNETNREGKRLVSSTVVTAVLITIPSSSHGGSCRIRQIGSPFGAVGGRISRQKRADVASCTSITCCSTCSTVRYTMYIRMVLYLRCRRTRRRTAGAPVLYVHTPKEQRCRKKAWIRTDFGTQ